MLLIDLLKRLTVEDTYNGTESETYGAVNFASALIADLYDVEGNGGDVEIGGVLAFVADPGSGYLFCDGSGYLRVDYPDLYAILPAWLIVDADNFEVPDLESRVVMGASVSRNPGATGGTAGVTLTEAQLAAHDHIIGQYFGSPPSSGGAGRFLGPTVGTETTEDAGGGEAHNNLQPYLTLDWFIKT